VRASGFRFFALNLCLLAMAMAPLYPSLAQTDRVLSAPPTEVERGKPAAPAPHHHGIIHHIEGGLTRAHHLLIRYGYPALFVSIFLEGCGIPAPGQTILMAASMDAAAGKLNVIWVLALALAAAAGGNAAGYAIGRWGGHPLLERLKVQKCRLERMEGRFARNGAGVLLVARFFDGLRQLNGIVAGLLEMPWRKFALWNTVGAALWIGVWGAGVYSLGRKMIVFVRHIFTRINLVILVFTVAAIAALLVYLLWHRRGRRADRCK